MSHRLPSDKNYFHRKDSWDHLRIIASDFSTNHQENPILNPFILCEHVFPCFDPYSTTWMNCLMVCKEWFLAMMEPDGLIWRESYKLLLNSIMKYYKYLLPSYLHNPMTVKYEVKELMDGTWQKNYDHVISVCLGLEQTSDRGAAVVAKLFLDHFSTGSNRGKLASVKLLHTHKILFDAFFPLIEYPSDRFSRKDIEEDFTVCDKQLYFIETNIVYDTLMGWREHKTGLLLKITCSSKKTQQIHQRYYAKFNLGMFSFILDVEQGEMINEKNTQLLEKTVGNNLSKMDEFSKLALNPSGIHVVDVTLYSQCMKSLMMHQCGNHPFATLFAKHWVCINTNVHPQSITMPSCEDDIFWFIHEKQHLSAPLEKNLSELISNEKFIIKYCKWYSWQLPQLFATSSKKKQESSKVLPEHAKELLEYNKKLKRIFNCSIMECCNGGLAYIIDGNGFLIKGLVFCNQKVTNFEVPIKFEEQSL